MFSPTAISILIDICIEGARKYPDSAHPFWKALAEIEDDCPSPIRIADLSLVSQFSECEDAL